MKESDSMKFTTFLRFMTLQMNARLQPKELNIVLGGSTVVLGITAIVTMILRQSIWLYLVLTAVMSLLMLLCMRTYARLFAKSQDEYLQKRSDDFKRWQAGLLKEEEEIELKEKLVRQLEQWGTKRSCDFSPVRADRVCGGDTAGLMQETIIKAVLKEPPEQRGGSFLCPENVQKAALQETAGNTHEFLANRFGIWYHIPKAKGTCTV